MTGFKCRYAVILAALTGPERQAVATTELTAADVGRILNSHGHKVSSRVIQRHRRQECGCK